MKRRGGLWDAVMERSNWVRAFHRAARGKRYRGEVRAFGADLDAHLDRLREAVASRQFEPGRFEVFRVFEPKERVIHAAPFEERVFQHALMNICEPVLDARLIDSTCACRAGRGQPVAIASAQRGAREYGWYLKLDIRKYFESVPHDLLMKGLHCVFKDEAVLYWLEKMVRSHASAPGRGLPIGSLTSQHLANFFLGRLDRFCSEHALVGRYVRYMDDFVCWGAEREGMKQVGASIRDLVHGELGLALKHAPCPQPTSRGMDFLGYRIFPSHLTLSRRSRVRYARKVRLLERLHEEGRVTEAALQERLTALVAFTLPVRAAAFRRRVHGRQRSTAMWRQSAEPGRQLEQHGEQLHRGEPEQQHSDQQQQQQRVPCRPQLRLLSAVDGRTEGGLNRSSPSSFASLASDERGCSPLGAGSSADVGATVPSGRLAVFSGDGSGSQSGGNGGEILPRLIP